MPTRPPVNRPTTTDIVRPQGLPVNQHTSIPVDQTASTPVKSKYPTVSYRINPLVAKAVKHYATDQEQEIGAAVEQLLQWGLEYAKARTNHV